MTYILSPQYEFLKEDDFDTDKLSSLNQKKNISVYSLLDTITGNILVLEPEMYAFLHCFIEPTVFDSVVQKFATEMQEPIADVQEALEPFFKNMLQRSILTQSNNSVNTASIIPLKVGDVVHKYVITSIVGDEGFLKMYIADNIETNESVFIKLLDERAIGQQEQLIYWRKRFEQETAILQELQTHPSVCRLIEVLKKGFLQIAVMELIEGNSLRHWLKPESGITLTTKKSLFADILAVYAFFHKQGVLHGDIHRSNIMIDKNDTVKIIDFDMAYHSPAKEGELIIQGGVKGYLAPEKISDNYFDIVYSMSDFKSEVYQLGVIGYFIFYEKLPFNEGSWAELTQAIREKEPEWGLNTEGVDDFLKKAMNKNPLHRFESAIEMAETFKQNYLSSIVS